MDKKKCFTIKDLFALLKLSCWSSFWKINGTASLAGGWYSLRHPFVCLLLLILAVFLVYWGFWFIAILLFIDPVKLIDALFYYTTTWYRNTGITPKEIVSDQGLYGEYLATAAAEKALGRSKGDGKIYNRILVPTENGDMTEIDIAVVGERLGVHLLEIKCRGGLFTGAADSWQWEQHIGREKYSLRNPIFQNQFHIKALKAHYKRKTGADFPVRIINVTLFPLKDSAWSISRPNAFHGRYLVSTLKDYIKAVPVINTAPSKEEYEGIVKVLDALKASSTCEDHQKFEELKKIS